MKVRLYLDEDSMRRALVQALRARGVAVTTALEHDMIEQPDERHLDFATQQGCVLYSFNIGDFYALHTSYLQLGKDHAGIIVAPQQQFTVGEQMRRILRLVAHTSAAEMRNRLEFLSNW